MIDPRAIEVAIDVFEVLLTLGRIPDAVRQTADDGIYWYPKTSDGHIDYNTYQCIEVFEDGETVAAWRADPFDDAWDLESLDAPAISSALDRIEREMVT